MIEIRKYRHTRFWAVYVDGELLAVVVYRKGAATIAELLRKMRFSKEVNHGVFEKITLVPGTQRTGRPRAVRGGGDVGVYTITEQVAI